MVVQIHPLLPNKEHDTTESEKSGLHRGEQTKATGVVEEDDNPMKGEQKMSERAARYINIGGGRDFRPKRPFRARARKTLRYSYVDPHTGETREGLAQSDFGSERTYSGGVGIMDYAIRVEDLPCVVLAGRVDDIKEML